MALVDVQEVGSLAGFLDAVAQFEHEKRSCDREVEELWFRGVRCATHMCVPGMYRDTLHDRIQEGDLIRLFGVGAPGMAAREPRGPWEWYYLMQHYGVPTRLLDWSRSALTALWFAVTGGGEEARTPRVYVLVPRSLNRSSIGCDYVLVPGRRLMEGWLPRDLKPDLADTWHCEPGSERKEKLDGVEVSNALPVSIAPRIEEARLAAQQGFFTVHGTRQLPLEQLELNDLRMMAIDIVGAAPEDLERSLYGVGVTRERIFPDLEGLAGAIRDRFRLTRGVAW